MFERGKKMKYLIIKKIKYFNSQNHLTKNDKVYPFV